ncbi:MAG: AMP-binding protein [Syntrophales bacterium]|nr:AMP-binding protein [Syntrophales bacterium]
MPTSADRVQTIPQMLKIQAEELGNSYVAIREKAFGRWETYTWKEYFQHVKEIALGLCTLGVKRQEPIVIIMDNHAEWLFAEMATMVLGGGSLNLFTTSIPDELAFAINRINPPVIFAQDQEQVDKLLEIKNKIPGVKRIVYIDPTGMRSYRNDSWLISFNELKERGKDLERAEPDRFSNELARGRGTDIAVYIQTSGTTGISKLAMLTHRGLLEMGRIWTNYLHIKPGENWFSMSPPAWIVDQMWGFGVAPTSGMTMNFPEMPSTVMEDFREIGPNIIITSSRFWEDMASRIRVKIADSAWINRKVFHWAEQVGRTYVDYKFRRSQPPGQLKLLYQLAKIIVYQPLLDRIGCLHMRCALTGGHPISPDVIKFFQAVGLNLKQCYGLTEAGGIFQVQPDDEVKVETVGKTLPGFEIKLSEEQEVLVKSNTLIAGYFNDFRATAAAFQDGWLKTGDAGYIDDDGHLIIIGRKEDIIRDKMGHAFSPDFVETRLKFSPYIKEAVVFGEGRPYITALINIDMENVGSWAEERLIPYTTYLDLSQQPAVAKLIKEEVRQVNTQIPDIMKIRKFILLYKLLDADDEELTRTGKVRRRFVYGVYLDMIEAMYQGKEDIEVTGKIRYRDGRVGEITTRVRIIDVYGEE